MQCQGCLPWGGWARCLAGSRGTRSVSVCAAAVPGELGSVSLSMLALLDILPQPCRGVGHPSWVWSQWVGWS